VRRHCAATIRLVHLPVDEFGNTNLQCARTFLIGRDQATDERGQQRPLLSCKILWPVYLDLVLRGCGQHSRGMSDLARRGDDRWRSS
jgi:hypothetical protein